jgi:hypothetical protein
MKAIFLVVALSCTLALHAKKINVTYTMQVTPDCVATFDGWVDVDMNPFSGTFLEATSYGGTVTIVGDGCNPGTYPVSGMVSGSIPDNGVTNGELNSIGYAALVEILKSDPRLNEQIEHILRG